METAGIDPEIVGGQQPASQAHAQAPGAPQPGQGAGGQLTHGQGSVVVPKSETEAGSDGTGNGQAGQAVQTSGTSTPVPHPATQAGAAAALAQANQYAAAAAYGPPVPVQPTLNAGAGGAGQVVGGEPHARVGKRRVRLGWTEEETRNLMEGCKRHGVGNWKKILTDPAFQFNCRTAVDLKDRFRTSFPEEYSRLYPNARTHKVKRVGNGNSMPSLIKVSRKERRAFSADEDERLLQGFLKHGPAWSKIQRDQTLGLGDRRSTDLRDRFRNAFPDRYTAAGYKGRSQGGAKNGGSGVGAGGSGASSDMQIAGALDDELSQQQGGVMAANGGRYIANPQQMMQQMQYQQYQQQQQQQAQQAQQYGQQAQPQQQRQSQQPYSQQYGQQAQQHYGQPMFYGMGMNQMPVQMTAGINQFGQMNPQMNAQMRQMPQMSIGQTGVWPNQQQ